MEIAFKFFTSSLDAKENALPYARAPMSQAIMKNFYTHSVEGKPIFERFEPFKRIERFELLEPLER